MRKLQVVFFILFNGFICFSRQERSVTHTWQKWCAKFCSIWLEIFKTRLWRYPEKLPVCWNFLFVIKHRSHERFHESVDDKFINEQPKNQIYVSRNKFLFDLTTTLLPHSSVSHITCLLYMHSLFFLSPNSPTSTTSRRF